MITNCRPSSVATFLISKLPFEIGILAPNVVSRISCAQVVAGSCCITTFYIVCIRRRQIRSNNKTTRSRLLKVSIDFTKMCFGSYNLNHSSSTFNQRHGNVVIGIPVAQRAPLVLLQSQFSSCIKPRHHLRIAPSALNMIDYFGSDFWLWACLF